MRIVVVILALGLIASQAGAGVIERACLGSERGRQAPQLCGCIQSVADVTLTRRDQRLAARFFVDPHQSQVVRQSDDPAHETFWMKYRSFGDRAESYCS